MSISHHKEILALLQLVDDPDSEVFETVADKLLDYGKDIIPRLEQLWETTSDESVQNRIENLIHRTLFKDLQLELSDWAKEKNSSLIDGAVIIAKYHYPDLDKKIILSEIDLIKKNIWLELNHYLSPLEQVNVINSILYNYYKLKGEENVNKDPKLYCINHLLENKEGNSFSIGILYLIICEALDIPIFAVDLPRQFVLGFFDNLFHYLKIKDKSAQTIQFYIDPVTGMVYTPNDVKVYLKKLNAPPSSRYSNPLGVKKIIFKLLEELADTYSLYHNEDKASEMRHLQEVLNPYILR